MKGIQLLLKDARLVKEVKTVLEKQGYLNKSVKIVRNNDDVFVIPTTLFEDDIDKLDEIINKYPIQVIYQEIHDQSTTMTETNIIKSYILKYLSPLQISQDLKESLIQRIPKKWTLYPPMMLINNQNTFDSSEWVRFLTIIDQNEFFHGLLLECFNSSITHIAINNPIIETDIMRRPFNLIPIHGDFGPELTESNLNNPLQSDFDRAFWCSVIQNGIYQTWSPRYTMFSRGNIKEKTRILQTFKKVRNECIVDLYAGIGYFTLSYLKLGARNLFCFEINPWSVQGLIRGVIKNGYSYKLIHHDEFFVFDPNVKVYIFQESNEFAYERLKDLTIRITHVNLGLLPSSKPSWSIALKLFDKIGDDSLELHIHENLGIDQIDEFMDEISLELLNLIKLNELNDALIEPKHLEKIKTFAPDVWHICADVVLYKIN